MALGFLVGAAVFLIGLVLLAALALIAEIVKRGKKLFFFVLDQQND